MMMWLMALRLALRALARNKLRATLTVLGILIGVAAVVAMTALGAGAKDRIEAQLASLGVNMLVVYPGATTTGGVRTAAGTAVGLTEDDARAISREVPSVSAVAPMLGASTQVVAAGRNASTRITGTTPDYFVVRAWNVASGFLFTDAEIRTASKVCLLGETVRQALFPNGEDPLGRSIRVGRMPCTVIGVLATKGQSSFGQDQDDTVIVPITTFRARILNRPNGSINSIMLSAREPNLTRRAEGAITALLRQRHHISAGDEPDFSVRNLQDLAQSFDEQRATLTFLLLAVASISLLVGGIGVMNIMLVSVTERTREIGIRLAIGARARDIMAQFLVEAVVLSAIGGVAGLGLGVFVSYMLGRSTQWSVKIQPDSALIAVAVASGIGVVFGFFPARSAAKLDPIVALRHE
jgi:putative ABC transport system permease protein